MDAMMWAAAGTGFTFLMTSLGAAMVFFLRKPPSAQVQRVFYGFAAGVMIAASIWSLLLPAMERAEEMGMVVWLPAAGGVICGLFFLLALDAALPSICRKMGKVRQDRAFLRNTLFFSAVTLHNVPEGMAVGLAFALAATDPSQGTFAAAAALAFGIGIQNFPEGAAISLPLLQEGKRPRRAFFMGMLSGAVEPLFGILAVAIGAATSAAMPWMLSFAAGAMLYVVVEELIPQAHWEEAGSIGTIGVMAGFLVMMILDVALG